MIKQKIQTIIAQATGAKSEDIVVEKPKSDFGDYATNIAFLLKIPAENLATKISAKLPPEIDRVEAKGGYVNFFLAPTFVQQELAHMQDDTWCMIHDLDDQTVIVEYIDANPFKLIHIGHLMTGTIGEAIARLFEMSGARVVRATYEGDAGLHVAMAVWGMRQGKDFLGPAYAFGSKAYNEDPETKKEIEDINKKIYDKSDPEINKLYQEGRQGSLDYFETIYKRLGTKFDQYFFESEMGPKGLEIVRVHKEIFEESDGAVVFRGEKYGLHTRVFINSQGLPTYEAKELGLAEAKWSQFHPDVSIVVTGNEINEYYRVLLKTMELLNMELATRTKHLGHGMLRLPTGKMSSRTGDVITAEYLIDEVKKIIAEKATTPLEDASIESIAIGAIKYSILKQGPGRDIVFDFDKSLSVQGDSGPYLQYTYARLHSILEKSQIANTKSQTNINYQLLNEQTELALIKHLMEFPDIIRQSREMYAPNYLALYLYELANKANAFYENVRVLPDDNTDRLNARLVLVQTTASILSRGLGILGIAAPEKV